jgi:hypothetical protein
MKLGTSLRRIVKVAPENWTVEVEYTDGFRGTVDLSRLFARPRGKPMVIDILRGDMFAKCFVESGALAWPNGYELCPDAVRAWIVQDHGRRATSAER